MTRLTILADENIPFAREAFGTLGDVRVSNGRRITPASLADVDLLIVRSITRVDRSLVAGSRVRFVGSATSGSDHVAVDELARMGVAFFAALGCNANAVAEYMTTAWLALAHRRGCSLAGRSVGVIGVGHVGSLVADKARALGLIPVLNDPPKARQTGVDDYRPIDDLRDCDIITCHTPLTYDGADSTYRLLGERFFARLKPGAWFCNAGRGEVVDEAALGRALEQGRVAASVIDVWDHEPEIDPHLLASTSFGTPHIAGYSFEGKQNATAMVYEAACRAVGVEPNWHAADAADAADAARPPMPDMAVSAAGRSETDVLAEITSAAYPIAADDEALRRTVAMSAVERGMAFDALRRAYPTRREFRQTAVALNGGSEALASTLRALEFRVL